MVVEKEFNQLLLLLLLLDALSSIHLTILRFDYIRDSYLYNIYPPFTFFILISAASTSKNAAKIAIIIIFVSGKIQWQKDQPLIRVQRYQGTPDCIKQSSGRLLLCTPNDHQKCYFIIGVFGVNTHSIKKSLFVKIIEGA